MASSGKGLVRIRLSGHPARIYAVAGFEMRAFRGISGFVPVPDVIAHSR